ncbi:MAG: hypothetical protein ACLFSE_12425 [Spirochaetia bacterium]
MRKLFLFFIPIFVLISCDWIFKDKTCSLDESPTLSGTISEDTILLYDPDCPTYRMTDDVIIQDGAVLTIESGITIVSEEGFGITVKADSGLNAIGTEDLPITFTGREEAAGHWMGIKFSNTENESNVFSYVTIEYGGHDNWNFAEDASNLFIRESEVSVKNSTLRNSGGHGFYFYLSKVTEFNDNRITGNTLNPGTLYANDIGDLSGTSAYTGNTHDSITVISDEIVKDQTWHALDVPYFFSGINHITEIKAALTIEAGAVLKFDENNGLRVKDEGSLSAVGTSGNAILFTGFEADSGHWRGLCFHGNDTGPNVLDNVTVEYGGSHYWYWGEDLVNILVREADLTLTNSTVRNSEGYGIYTYYGTVSQEKVTFENNTLGEIREEP